MCHPPPVSVEICTNEINHDWDIFISTIPGVCHEQTSAWGLTSRISGWKAHRIILKKNQTIVGGVQILVLQFPLIGKFGYVQQGPCIKVFDHSLIEQIITEIKKFTSSQNLHYLTIEIAYILPNVQNYLLQNAFIIPPPKLPPTTIISSTLILDLSQDLDVLMSSFKSGRRKSIRSGLKHNIKIRTGTREDISLLFDLINQTCERRQTNSHYPDINYFYSLWDNFAKHDWIILHIAEIDGQSICASLSYTFGDTFRNSIWGWSGNFIHLNASDVIDWKTICWAKANGFRYYDFVHLDTPSAKAILSGEEITQEIKNRPHYGSTFYKMRFGGEVIFYPGTYSFFPSNFKKRLFMFISGFGLNNPVLKSCIRLMRKFSINKK